MRGKPIYLGANSSVAGITPADAGKTHRPRILSPHVGDHPRGCGENYILGLFIPSNLGSPPRMRGKRVSSRSLKFNIRITPADAGKTTVIYL